MKNVAPPVRQQQQSPIQRSEHHDADITITGAGVLTVNSTELVKTDEVSAQLKALRKLIDQGLISTTG
jgi:hypothetical protein